MIDELDLEPIKALLRAAERLYLNEPDPDVEAKLHAQMLAEEHLKKAAPGLVRQLVAEVERLRKERGDSENAGPEFVAVPVGSAARERGEDPERLHPGDVVLVTGHTDPAMNGLRVVGDVERLRPKGET